MRHRADGGALPRDRRLQLAIADRLVFARIRARLGGRLEILASESAALAPQIAEWFAAAGLPILEGYGWFATGDVGQLDAHGYLRLTDRKKDLVKTSGGKYIAPTPIESAIKAACPLIGTAIVVAEGRRFASLLATLDPDAARTVPPEDIHEAIAQAVAGVNAGLNRWETIKTFRTLPRELSIDAGEITPSLKVKRAVVARNYAQLIEAIYAEAPQ